MKVIAGLAALFMLAGCASSAANSGNGGNGSAGFVGKIKQNAEAAASDATGLLAEAAVADETDQSQMTQVASDAQALHGHLEDFRQQILTESDASDAGQMNLVTAENDLKSGVGAVDTWAGDSNPSHAASWQRQLGAGIGEWNRAVTALWAKAGVASAPTITIPK